MSGWPPLHSPSFDGATGWLNSRPLTDEGLRGKVVLVNFWTLTCINWLRQEPYVRAWAQAFRDDGLVVIGAHTPEFSFEHDVERIRRATERFGIDYPVAIDSDYGVWEAFANHYWPALYFIDRDGMIRDQHFGEGRYEESESVIKKLLGIERPPLRILGTGIEAPADWETLRSPETYLGRERGERPSDAAADALHTNQWTLTGDWDLRPEYVRSGGPGAGIAFRFHARDVHLVMSPGDHGPMPFVVTLDGEEPGDAHGGDIDAGGNGILDDGRLWQLIRVPGDVRARTVQITFPEAGAEAYCFTFG